MTLTFAAYCLAMIPFVVGCVVITENLLDRVFGKAGEDARNEAPNGDVPHLPRGFRDTTINQFPPIHSAFVTQKDR